jgi:xylulokinase
VLRSDGTPPDGPTERQPGGQAFLGLDLGTSSLKAIIVDGRGRTLAIASAGYPLAARHPDWSETDAGSWWDAAISATRRACESAGRPTIGAVGLSGQMHGHVLVDAAAEPLRPAILWSDGRAESERARFESLTAGQRRRLANPFMAGAAGATLVWLAAHEPATYTAARWSLQPKDWLRTRLLAESPVTDASDASATLLWDVPTDRRAEDVIADLGLRSEMFPPVCASTAIAGNLSDTAAATLGLEAGIPVAVGSGDAAAAAVGTGLSGPGRVQMTVGTGAQILLLRDDPAVDPTGRTHLYRSAVDGQWYAMAAVQNSGLALDWVRRTLGLEWPTLFAAARTGLPLGDDPFFIPNVTRERPYQPHPGPGAAFVGAHLHHSASDLSAAALEGVALGIRLALEALPGAADTGALLLAGGGGMAPGYRQMLADILGRDLESVEAEAASARGAALIAGVAAGHWSSIAEAAATTVGVGAITAARPEIHRAYTARLARFQELARRIA